MYFIDNLLSFLRDREYQRLLRVTTIILILGTFAYHYLEGWSWLDSFYFSIITLTTIGYGDFSPQTMAGKLYTILYILIGIGIILGFIDTVYKHYKRNKPQRGNK
ncbi:MAG: potassium channel family protein [Flavobacteriaceae bacterium]